MTRDSRHARTVGRHTSMWPGKSGKSREGRINRLVDPLFRAVSVVSRLHGAVRHTTALLTAAMLAAAPRAEARVVRIEILSRESAYGGERFGAVGAYERIVGRAYGELDPNDRRNAVINDILLAPRNARGMVEYVATFTLLKPVDAARGNGVLLHDMVNRGSNLTLPALNRVCADRAPGVACDPQGPGDGFLFREGYTLLWNGWQGDLAPRTGGGQFETVRVPVARNADGSPITGPVLARWVNPAAGATTLTLVQGGITAAEVGASLPASLDPRAARLETHAAETPTGEVRGVAEVPSADWAWGDCTRAPFPGAPDSTRICLRNGADPALLYQLVYTARDPLVLLVGFAATRDVGAFFRYEARDDAGTPSPLAGAIAKVVGTGPSQSGNAQRTFILGGFNEDDSGARGRVVWDGANPHIAARQTPMNFRFARPGGAASLYEAGSEGFVWWERYRDAARGRPAGGLLDRCRATATCPRIVETLGSAEFWGLRASPDFAGTDGRDIPLPPNVRRYYFPGTTHGGGSGAFTLAPPAGGACALASNPAPIVDHHRALLVALTRWVTRGEAPPPSRYPRVADGTLATPAAVARRFPRIPGVPGPEGMLNPLLDYDFGPALEPTVLRGHVTVQPPAVRRVLPSWVPQVDADGNETAGVKSPLFANPLGTYLGWNVTASGFAKGQPCGFAGGFVPLARTRAEREASGDPRRSLEERYASREAYVRGVAESARRLVAERLLLQEDADRIVERARAAEGLP
jgi:hypothetical protein